MRNQAGLSYLIIIAIALIILVISTGALYTLGVLNPATYVKKSISGLKKLQYVDHTLYTYGKLLLKVKNGAGQKIRITDVKVNGKGTLLSQVTLSPGKEDLIEVSGLDQGQLNSPYNFKIQITYRVLSTGIDHTEIGQMSGKYERGEPWWSILWSYRRFVNVSSNKSLSDYQISAILDTQSLISAGKMRNDCGDLRVIDSDDVTQLPFWIENCNSTGTKIWIKVPHIPTGNKTIYIYYGNPSASSESNISETFIRIIEGLQASWHFDEGSGITADDTSGNDNDGTVYGANWTSGKFGEALSFDGVNDYVEVDDSDSLDITDEITIEAWIYLNQLPPAIAGRDWYSILVKPYYGYAYGLMYTGPYSLSPNRFRFYHQGLSAGYTDGPVSLNISEWYHIIATYNGSKTKIYLNGGVIGSESVTGSITTNNENVFIGINKNGEYPFNGTIDEVRIYSNALSAGEVLDLYNNYGYTTTNYPGKVLVRKRVDPEPSVSVGAEQSKQ